MTDERPEPKRVVAKEEKSLNEILGVESAPGEDDWALAHRIYRAAAVPISQLTDGDLGLLLRQRYGASHVLPTAFERLRDDIWNEAGLYPGALLIAALRNLGRMPGHLDFDEALTELLNEALSRSPELSEHDRRAFQDQVVLVAPDG